GATSANLQIIKRINGEVSIPVEVGGGLRSLADIEFILRDVGARYAIIGTLAVEQPDLLKAAVAAFGDAVVVGIDARDGQVATRGGTAATRVAAPELAREVTAIGVRRIIYTDIARDGRLKGPTLEATREIARRSGARVTASGGVGTLEDISGLRELERD